MNDSYQLDDELKDYVRTILGFSPTQPIHTKMLLTRQQAAKLLHTTSGTLATWHSTGRYAIEVVYIGSKPMYPLGGCLEHLNSGIQSAA